MLLKITVEDHAGKRNYVYAKSNCKLEALIPAERVHVFCEILLRKGTIFIITFNVISTQTLRGYGNFHEKMKSNKKIVLIFHLIKRKV